MVIRYLKYNIWANQRFNAALLALSDEQFDREIVSSFPSMRRTLLHIWDANKIWHIRLNGEFPGAFPSKDPAISGLPKAEIVAGVQASCDVLLQYAEANASRLGEAFHYKDMAGNSFSSTLEEILHHVVNHATFHRGQIVTLLRQLGARNGYPADGFYQVGEGN